MQAKYVAARLMATVLTVAGAASAEHPAPDADRIKAAAEEFDAGRRAYKLREFENAATHFETADRDVPSAEALVSAIRARREAEQLARAATLAALAQVRYPDDKSVAETVSQVLPVAAKSLHRVRVACSPDCSLVVDSRLAPFPESASATLYLDPGSHSVVASFANRRQVAREVAAVAGGQTELTLSPSQDNGAGVPNAAGPAAAGPAVEPPLGDTPSQAVSRKGLPVGWFIAGAVTTGVLGGVTLWSGIDTLNNPGQDRIRNECQNTDCELYRDGVARQNRTNVLIGVTSVVAAATVVAAIFTDWGKKPASRVTSLVPVVALDQGAMIGAAGRFR